MFAVQRLLQCLNRRLPTGLCIPKAFAVVLSLRNHAYRQVGHYVWSSSRMSRISPRFWCWSPKISSCISLVWSQAAVWQIKQNQNSIVGSLSTVCMYCLSLALKVFFHTKSYLKKWCYSTCVCMAQEHFACTCMHSAHTCTHANKHICFPHTHNLTYMCCMHTHLQGHIHTYTHAYSYIHCVCVYIYIYTWIYMYGAQDIVHVYTREEHTQTYICILYFVCPYMQIRTCIYM